MTTGEGPRARPPAETLSQKGEQTTVRKPGSAFVAGGVVAVVLAGGDLVVAGVLGVVGLAVVVAVGNSPADTDVAVLEAVGVVAAMAVSVAGEDTEGVSAGVFVVAMVADGTMTDEESVRELSTSTVVMPTTMKNVASTAAT